MNAISIVYFQEQYQPYEVGYLLEVNIEKEFVA
jgi:hypothetical protein